MEGIKPHRVCSIITLKIRLCGHSAAKGFLEKGKEYEKYEYQGKNRVATYYDDPIDRTSNGGFCSGG